MRPVVRDPVGRASGLATGPGLPDPGSSLDDGGRGLADPDLADACRELEGIVHVDPVGAFPSCASSSSEVPAAPSLEWSRPTLPRTRG